MALWIVLLAAHGHATRILGPSITLNGRSVILAKLSVALSVFVSGQGRPVALTYSGKASGMSPVGSRSKSYPRVVVIVVVVGDQRFYCR